LSQAPFSRPSLAFLFALVLYAYCRVHEPKYANAGDNRWYVPTAQALLADGTLELSRYAGPVFERSKALEIVQIGDGWFNFFPYGPSLVAAPFVAGLNLILPLDPADPLERDYQASVYVGAILAAASVVVTTLIARRLTGSSRWGLAVGLLFGFATCHLATNAAALWSHNVALLLTSLALLALLSEFRGRPIAMAALLVLAFACRPTAALFAVVPLTYELSRRRFRSALAFCVANALLLAVWILATRWLMGTWLHPYYFRNDGPGFALARFIEALGGNLVSPGRGLFVFMPIALVAALGWLVAASREVPQRALFVALGAWCALHWLLISTYWHWWGGYSYGPRLFADVYVAIALLCIPAAAWILARPKPSRLVWMSAAGACALASLCIAVKGGYGRGQAAWTSTPESGDAQPERLWGWSALQFLRTPAR
jgi:hypothetical protein